MPPSSSESKPRPSPESKPPPSSKSKPQWIYDVFINFRGEDTRRNFVSHLYAALSNAGINTFLDDEKLQKGYKLGPELMRAIEGSQISIVVFSENYTESSWCLNELVKIMECHATRGQVVLPVFYDVTPSDLRHRSQPSEEILRGRRKLLNGNLVGWKKALSEASNLSGWNVRNFRNENMVVKQIIDTILKKMDTRYLSIPDFPVGLESRAEQVIQFLRNKRRGVCIVGILGMGGIGKSTIAKVILNKLLHEFEDQSFLANIREVWKKERGQIDLQEQLLSDILKTRKMKVHSIEWGKAKERLRTKRALVVLDDVNEIEQLNVLCGNRDGIGSGSIIIITTRDARILNFLGVDYVYRVEELNETESLELFNWHAFREASSGEGFFNLSRDVVAYCGGLPLALEVLGCYLYERIKEEWHSVLSKLRKIPNDEIHEKLKISFDGLKDDMEKDIFLDICCFFIGKDRAYVTKILNGCGLHADIGITVLVEKSLMKVERNNKLGMHDLLRDMGREIVRESAIKEPEKRSRLWFHEDVLDVLTNNKGTEAIEGLALKLHETSRYCLNANAFEDMKRLRLLQIDHVQLIGDYGHFSKQLRWICWHGFPLEDIPDKFYQGNVVAIDLKHSNLKQIWKEPQLLEWLKFLNLSYSKYLTVTPDFSKLPNLEKLIMKDCPNLCKIHQSIGDLHNLLLINLKDCISLRNLPSVIYKLTSLETLILSGCSKIDKLEEDIVQMKSLATLIAENTAVKQVPFSIIRLESIGYISLCGYEGSSRDVFPSLIWSWMSPTMKPLSRTPSFGVMLSSLVSINMQNNCSEDLSPMLSRLSKLRSVLVQCETEFQLFKELRAILDAIYFVNFTELEITSNAAQISNHSLRSYLIGMGNCHEVFNTLSKSISEGLTTNGSFDVLLPGDNYPYWLTHTGEGHSVPFTVPQDNHYHMKGMTLCVFYSPNIENTTIECITSVLIVNYTKLTIQIYKRDTTISFNDEDWQGLVSHLGSGDKVEIFVTFEHGLVVKNIVVYLIYDELIEVEMDPSLEPTSDELIDVEMDPSLEPTNDELIDVEMDHSLEPTNDELIDVEMDPFLEPKEQPKEESKEELKKNVFVRFIKKIVMCKCYGSTISNC